jgi:hypothetical protein
MRPPLTMLFPVVLLGVPRVAPAQSDTLPERVVTQAYEAVQRCDRTAYYSLFAPVWYYSKLEDSTTIAARRSRDQALRVLDPRSGWAECGDKPRAPRGNYNVLHRIVLGPYVVDETGGQYIHLDIFEVRHGRIIHEWESDNYASWSHSPS